MSLLVYLPIDYTGMMAATRHFLFVPHTIISGYSTALKKQWLASVQLGRSNFTANLQPVSSGALVLFPIYLFTYPLLHHVLNTYIILQLLG